MKEPTNHEVDAAYVAQMRHTFGPQYQPTDEEIVAARPAWRAGLVAAYAMRGER